MAGFKYDKKSAQMIKIDQNALNAREEVFMNYLWDEGIKIFSLDCAKKLHHFKQYDEHALRSLYQELVRKGYLRQKDTLNWNVLKYN